MNKSQRITVAVGIIITFLAVVFGLIYAHFDYSWENQKCLNLKSANYEFTHDVQLNADYASNCYWYQHHPFGYAANLLGGALMALVLSGMLWMGILFIKMIISDTC